MAFIFAIIVLLFVFIANTNREKKVEDSITEIKKKWNIEAEEKKEKEEYIVNKIVRDRICKYFNDIYFVLNEKTFLQLIWSENGDTLYHIISEFNNYQNIEIEENIEKSYIEYIKINDIRYLLENLYDIIIPDIKQLNENIEQTQRSINIAKNLENGTQYIQLMKKYLITMEKLLKRAIDLNAKYRKFIKEIYAQYEIDKFEKTMSISIIDRNINYKNIEDNLLSQYNEYSTYRKIYEDLSKELSGTL